MIMHFFLYSKTNKEIHKRWDPKELTLFSFFFFKKKSQRIDLLSNNHRPKITMVGNGDIYNNTKDTLFGYGLINFFFFLLFFFFSLFEKYQFLLNKLQSLKGIELPKNNITNIIFKVSSIQILSMIHKIVYLAMI
jgi:hypothetical protein